MSTSHTIRAQFEINWTNIKGGCQSGRKVVTHDSKSDLPLEVIAVFKSSDYFDDFFLF